MPDAPEPLSPDDAAILALESEAIAGHTMKLITLGPAARPLDLEHLRATVADSLAAEPRATQRVTWEGERAYWRPDEAFDLALHVRRRAGTAGLDEAGMRAEAGRVMAEKLDHDRPLWSLDLIGPLADGSEAIAARIHHAMADGISCMRFLDAVLWTAEAPPAERRPPSGGAAPARPRSRAAELARLPGALRRELGTRTRATPLDRPIGQARELAFAVVPLADLREIGASRPGHVTVNDVLLAAVAGGLRTWLGAERARRLRAQVPVSLHHRAEGEDALGNRDSFLNVDLPLEPDDPLARLDRVNDETSRRKQLGDADELYDFFHALARFKHVGPATERLVGGPHEFSLSISNVPGPPTEISVCGRAVERLCSVAEPAQRHALRVSALSCAGTVAVGLCTDPQALSGVADLATAIEDSFAELRAAAIQ